MRDGTPHALGLASFPAVSLAKARAGAQAKRENLPADPKGERAARHKAKADARHCRDRQPVLRNLHQHEQALVVRLERC
jgi:hypothetical protein